MPPSLRSVSAVLRCRHPKRFNRILSAHFNNTVASSYALRALRDHPRYNKNEEFDSCCLPSDDVRIFTRKSFACVNTRDQNRVDESTFPTRSSIAVKRVQVTHDTSICNTNFQFSGNFHSFPSACILETISRITYSGTEGARRATWARRLKFFI